MPMAMTFNIYGNRQRCDMAGSGFNQDSQGGCVAAKALRADIKLIDSCE